MKDSYLAYLESKVELQALRIERLEIFILLLVSYLNSLEGLQLGRDWLEKYGPEILSEIKANGGFQAAVRELKKVRNLPPSNKLTSST